MKTLHEPRFASLDEADIRSVLARNSVGRLAYVRRGEVEIRPLHYVYHDGCIYGRTSPDADILRMEEYPSNVVFEVDEVASVFHWKSVIAKGRFDVIPEDLTEAEERDRVAHLLRRVVRNTFDPTDPVPGRTVIFRILITQLSGRTSMLE